MPTGQESDSAIDEASGIVAAITARLAARHDGLAVLGAVTEACGSLLSADTAGVLVTDPRGGMEVIAAADERPRYIELLRAQIEEGPCVECIDGNAIVHAVDVDTERWPRFAPLMKSAGLGSVFAFPLRLMDRAVGALNVFYCSRTELEARRLRFAQALADLAVLGLTQERDQRRVERLAEQTLTTLNDRARIGHAAGLIVGTLDVPSNTARALLLAHAVAIGRTLSDVARAITDGTLSPLELSPNTPDGSGDRV